jgi:hypothetical protein
MIRQVLCLLLALRCIQSDMSLLGNNMSCLSRLRSFGIDEMVNIAISHTVPP